MANKKHSGLGRGLDALIPQDSRTKRRQEAAEKAGVNISGDTLLTDAAAADEKENAVLVRISKVEPNRSQPRKKFDEEGLEELADSIKKYGILQPILVQDRENYYEIVAGERRWRAAQKAGLKEIPVIIRKYSDQEILELSLIENIQREDLSPIEEARAYRQLMEEFGLKQEDIAEKVSKSRSAVTNTMRLLKLDERVQNLLENGSISMGHARALIPVEDPEKQYELAQKIADENLSVRDVEKLIRQNNPKKENSEKKKSERKEIDETLTLFYRKMETTAKESLGTKVSIKPKGKKGGRIEIEYYSEDDLEKIMNRLSGSEL